MSCDWMNELNVYILMTETLVQGRNQRQQDADIDHLNYIHPHPASYAGARFRAHHPTQRRSEDAHEEANY